MLHRSPWLPLLLAAVMQVIALTGASPGNAQPGRPGSSAAGSDGGSSANAPAGQPAGPRTTINSGSAKPVPPSAAGGPVSATAAAPGGAVAASPIAADQARHVLDVLRDDARRAELISVLDVIARTGGPAADAKPPAPVADPKASAPVAEVLPRIPLQPDSLGVAVAARLAEAMNDAGRQLIASLKAVNDLPLLWRWIVNVVTDEDNRARAIDSLWRLGAIGAAAFAAGWLTRLALRRPRSALNRTALGWTGAGMPLAEPSAPDPAAESTGYGTMEAAAPPPMQSGFGSWRLLPALLCRLLLDLAPLVPFAIVAHVLITTELGNSREVRNAVRAFVIGYAGARASLELMEFLVAPIGGEQRLLPVTPWAAAFLMRWVRRIAVLIAVGYVLAVIGRQLGMFLTAYEALLKLVGLAVHTCLVVVVLQARKPVARLLRGQDGGKRGFLPRIRDRLADRWHLIAIFYIVALWLVWAIELRDGYSRLVRFFIVTVAVMLGYRVLSTASGLLLDRLRAMPALASADPWVQARADSYHPALRGLVEFLLRGLTIVTLLEVWGIAVVDWFVANGLASRTATALTLIAVTVLSAILVWETANTSIELHLAQLKRSAEMARAGRLRTLLPMLRTVLMAIIVLVVGLIVLSELGVNIAPLLAGAGVVGIAVGFGSQKLVQDLITGLFLLLENAMQVGDVVTVGGMTGTVEALSIRTIRLRALDGSVHLIPFSAVTTVTNQTRDYGYAVLDVSIGLNEEPDRIVAVLTDVAEVMRAEPRWQSIILEPLDVMGVERFVDLAWVMRMRIKTQPSSRWAVSRELNRRIKERFDELAIESPITSYRSMSNQPSAGAAPQGAA